MGKVLTDKEAAYVRFRAEGFPAFRCAELAGYEAPDHTYCRLERRESIKKAIFAACMKRIGQELLPKALKTFDSILAPESAAPTGIKLKAAQYVTDKAIELQAMASARDIADKNPLEMSQAELEVFIMRGRVVLTREKAKREALASLGVLEGEAHEVDHG